MKKSSIVSFLLFLLFLFVLINQRAFATECWTEEDLQKWMHTRENSASLKPRIPLIPSWIDEYVLLDEYLQICDFLVLMQDTTHTINFGGLHEGETTRWNIIETDNTQEAIRVWCTYAELFNDLERYRQNVEAAWIYTMNFPAYDEGGSTSIYYSVHNCGWALVAESKYRQVYGDDSYLWYADSCAQFMKQNHLYYTPATSGLNPLVDGWAAGTLYDYGVEQSDPSAVDSALFFGTQVKSWIEYDPQRLSTNEVWAMSGGTALWGVCRSVFTADPAAGQSWLPEYLPHMDSYAGPGQWNNSWNVWYAHAYHASAGVLEDPGWIGYAFALVDTLLDADTDNDGGIMATSTDPDSIDQSWVSCYLNYMGMESFLLSYPMGDAIALGFTEPDTTLPIAQWQTVDITALVANFNGQQPFGNVDVQLSGAFTASASTFLEVADVDTIFLGQWTPSDPGVAQLILSVSPGGVVSENDTLVLAVNVLGWGEIGGTITDAGTGLPISAELDFYLLDFPASEPQFSIANDPVTGAYHLQVIEGNYRVVVDPELPYTDREANNVLVVVGQMTNLNFSLHPAPLLLVDDDGGDQYETYYLNPLAEAEFDTYWWDVYQRGTPDPADLSIFDGVVWFTGNALDSALTPAEINALIQFLDSGGNLLISGQNIAQSIPNEPFLSQYLGASFGSTTTPQFQVYGIEGDPVTAGMEMWFPGAGGAGNQTSPDQISAVGAGTLAAYYGVGAQPGAMVRVEDDYKSLFLAFGLEGVSGANNTTTRLQFLTAVMDWFDIQPMRVSPQINEVNPAEYSLLLLYPNPFNSTVHLSFQLPQQKKAELSIYNLQGELLETRLLDLLQPGVHNLDYQFRVGFSSGMYVFVVQTNDKLLVSRGLLIK